MPLTFGKKDEQIFLGREINQHSDYSEDTAIKIDQEVKWVTIKSENPDEFQLTHPDERPNPEEEEKKADPLSLERPPEEKTVDIIEGQKGISYEKLFLPYLRGAKSIKICDG